MKLKDIIKNAKDLKTDVIKIEEWDNIEIEVRTMTAAQRADLYSAIDLQQGKFDQKVFQAKMIIASCYDPKTKEKIFDDKDADWLMEKASGPIERLSAKITKISGLSNVALEMAEKN